MSVDSRLKMEEDTVGPTPSTVPEASYTQNLCPWST